MTTEDTTDAESVDVKGHIVAPGMIDTHRHTWQTQLRALCADCEPAVPTPAFYTPAGVGT